MKKTYIDELVEKVSEATGLKSKETVKMYSLLVLIRVAREMGYSR